MFAEFNPAKNFNILDPTGAGFAPKVAQGSDETEQKGVDLFTRLLIFVLPDKKRDLRLK